jgi:hypothetical protein
MKKTLITFFTIFFCITSSVSWSKTLLLKCKSQKFRDEDWFGAIMMIDINFKTKFVRIMDGDRGWFLHKLTSSSNNYYIIKECRSHDCLITHKDTHKRLDRVTGILKEIVDLTRFGGNGYDTRFEYNCKKTKVLF